MEIRDANFSSLGLCASLLQSPNATITGLNTGVILKHSEIFLALLTLRVRNKRLFNNFHYSIGGIGLSCVISDERSIGSSTAIYGMIGAYVALMILYRNSNQR